MFKMADVPVLGFQKFWTEKQATLKSDFPFSVSKFSDEDSLMKQVYKILGDNEDFAGHTTSMVEESSEWASVVKTAEENLAKYCKILGGRTPFAAVYCTYTVTLNSS
jgi:hypothetical protein